MIEIYRTDHNELQPMEWVDPGCWIHLTNPTDGEIARAAKMAGADPDLIRAALDEEERARLEQEDDQLLVLVDIPFVEAQTSNFAYTTLPLGIITTRDALITVCLRDTPILRDFIDGRVKQFSTKKRTRFILQMLYRIATKYLLYLKQIDKASILVEEKLQKSMKNQELLQMFKLEKSLVFFSTSLKSNEVVLERLLRMSALQQYPDDTDLLEDVIVENKQAIEMCAIYRDILSGTMDAFASVISNNLNIVMKTLTTVTIVMSVPAIVFGLWGTNVPVPFENSPYGFGIVVVVSVLVTVLFTLYMAKKKLF